MTRPPFHFLSSVTSPASLASAIAVLLLAGCTLEDVGKSAGGGDVDDTPANADASRVFAQQKVAAVSNSLVTGIWESARPQTSGPLTSTSRFEFRDAFVVAAARCTRDGVSGDVLVGGRSSALVTGNVIQIDQAISDQRTIGGDAACAVRASAGVLPACDPGTAPAARTTPCFELTGTTLDLYQGSAGIQSFVKISD